MSYIDDKIIDDFNNKTDELHLNLIKEAISSQNVMIKNRLFELANMVEISRRMFNTYAETGLVIIPE